MTPTAGGKSNIVERPDAGRHNRLETEENRDVDKHLFSEFNEYCEN